MSNSKISALTSATLPLDGTEVLPVIQSSTTKKVANNDLRPKQIQSNATSGIMQVAGPAAASTRVMTIPDANFTAARTDAGQTFTGTQAFAGITATNASVATGSTVIVAGATSGSAATLQSGTGTFALTGASNRGIGVLVNSNQNTNITLPYGGSYEVFGLLSTTKAVSGGGYTIYGLAGYAESDGSPMGVRADAKSTVAANPAYGLYIGSVTGATNNYGVYVADTSAVNYFGGNVQFGTAAKGINFTANTPASGMTSQLLNWYEEGTWTPNQGAGLTLVGAFSSTGRYTRIGRQVSISGTVTGATSVAVTAAGVITSNLPFTVVTAGHGDATNVAINASAAVICTSTNVTAASAIAATATITFSATYFV